MVEAKQDALRSLGAGGRPRTPLLRPDRALTMEMLGTRLVDGYLTTMSDLDYVSRDHGQKRGEIPLRLNAALAMVEAIAPRNELEAALAVQMAGCHALTMEMLGKARHAEDTRDLELFGNFAVKFTGTFTVECRATLREIRDIGRWLAREARGI